MKIEIDEPFLTPKINLTLLREECDRIAIKMVDANIYARLMLNRISELQDAKEKITLIADRDEKKCDNYFDVNHYYRKLKTINSNFYIVRHPFYCRFCVHRLVLCASSDYFVAMLGPNFMESNANGCRIHGADGETLKTIVDFVYTGQITITEQNVDKLLSIATQYDINLLSELCRQYRSENLQLTNCVDTFSIADKFNLLTIRRSAYKLICNRFEQIPSLQLGTLNFGCFVEIIQSDTNTANEDYIFTQMMKWIGIDINRRSKHAFALLKCIRLEYISPEVH